jgi:IS5 family transposase
MAAMTQSNFGFDPVHKKTRKEIFLEEMNRVVPWAALVGIIRPHARGAHQALGGRPPFAVETMLRIHCLQLWWNLSDPAMEEELHERPLYREFAGLAGSPRIPDETTILRFRHLLEKHDLAARVMAAINAGLAQQGLMLKTGTIVDATIIAAPSSTKNQDGERDPEMHQAKKGNAWHFGMKAHIGVDAESGLVHTVIGTAANVNDVTQGAALLHGEEEVVFADAGYRGIDKREEAEDLDVIWHVAMQPGKRRALNPKSRRDRLREKAEKLKASVRAKVEHPFRVGGFNWRSRCFLVAKGFEGGHRSRP